MSPYRLDVKLVYLRLGGGKLGGTAALRSRGELGELSQGSIELWEEGGVALLEEGTCLLDGDRGGVRLGTDGSTYHRSSRMAVSPRSATAAVSLLRSRSSSSDMNIGITAG
jgi:hypothetical protein